MVMRSKSFPVRSPRKSLDPYPSLADGIFGGVEMAPVTFDGRDQCLVASENGSGGSEPLLNLDACVVCEISDKWASRCSGIDCPLSFHIECLKEASTEEDLAKPYYCPYCWFHILARKSKLPTTLREKALGEEKALVAQKAVFERKSSRDEVKESVPKSQEDDENGNQEHSVDRTDIVGDQELQGEVDACSSKGEHVQVDKDSDKSRGDNLPSALGYQERVSAENFPDETAQDQTRVNACAGKKGDGSGKENDHVQQNEKPSRRRRIVLKAIDREISLNESTNEPTGEDVTQLIDKVAKPKPVRDISFFNNNQTRRILWTSKEEEMLKVGLETYASEANMNMPWRKILEMGKKVFHETRTPAGLKDKWRNMIRAKNKQDSTLMITD